MPKKSLGFAALMTSLGVVGGVGATTAMAGAASAAPLPESAPIPSTSVPAAAPAQVAGTAPKTYTVRPGDTLSALAARFGTTVAALAEANNVADVNVIYAGQVLDIARAGYSAGVASRPAYAAQPTSYAPRAAVSSNASPSGVWGCIARLESGGNPAANTGNGYYGMFQFSPESWRAAGGAGSPADASASEQLAAAQRLQATSGWGNWPVTAGECGA